MRKVIWGGIFMVLWSFNFIAPSASAFTLITRSNFKITCSDPGLEEHWNTFIKTIDNTPLFKELHNIYLDIPPQPIKSPLTPDMLKKLKAHLNKMNKAISFIEATRNTLKEFNKCDGLHDVTLELSSFQDLEKNTGLLYLRNLLASFLSQNEILNNTVQDLREQQRQNTQLQTSIEMYKQTALCPACPVMSSLLPEGMVRGQSIKPFRLSIYEVTVAQWRIFAEETQYHKPECDSSEKRLWREFGLAPYKPKDHHPIICVSYDDIQRYLTWLNQEYRPSGTPPYRLPTYDEFLYMAQGDDKRYYWGDKDPVCDPSSRHGIQFYSSNRRNCTVGPKSVGSFQYNQHPYGLFDLLGNVREFSSNCSHNHCILYGGSWRSRLEDVIPHNPLVLNSNIRKKAIGFRIAQDAY